MEYDAAWRLPPGQVDTMAVTQVKYQTCCAALEKRDFFFFKLRLIFNPSPENKNKDESMGSRFAITSGDQLKGDGPICVWRQPQKETTARLSYSAAMRTWIIRLRVELQIGVRDKHTDFIALCLLQKVLTSRSQCDSKENEVVEIRRFYISY